MLQHKGSGLPDAGKADGQRLQMLADQNSKLSAQLEVQRKENYDLEAKVSNLQSKQIDYEQTLSCVDRLWTQLNDDITFMARRAGFVEDGDSASSASGQDHLTGNGISNTAMQDIEDPFLRRLVRADSAAATIVSAKSKELREDSTDVEAVLMQRSAATKKCLAQLLEKQVQHQQSLAELVSRLGRDAGPSVEEEVNKALAEAAAARRELDAQKAISRAQKEQQQILEDQRIKDEIDIKKLTNELADKNGQLAAVQRKLVLMRANSVADVQPSATAAGRQDANAAAQQSSNNAEAAAEAEEDRKLLAQREAELDAQKEANMKLQQDLQSLQEQIAREAFVPQSNLYQQMQRQLHATREELEKQRQATITLQQERASMQRRQATQELQVENGEHAKKLLAISQQREHELEQELQAARAAADDSDFKLQRERARAGQTKTVGELQQLIAALQKDKKLLQTQVAQHKAAAQRVEEVRQEALLALTALKEKEIAIGHLQQALGRKLETIAELRNSEREAKIKAEEMQAFVEVLLEYSEAQPDVMELNRTEARLRAEISSLKNRLEGPERQAELDRLSHQQAKAQSEADALRKENDALRIEVSKLNRTVADVSDQLKTSQEASVAYTDEIEVISSAFDDLQSQNTRLLQQMAKRDDLSNQLVSERIKIGNAAAQHKQEQASAAAAVQRAERLAAVLQERVNELQSKLQASIDEASGLRERSHNMAVQLEVAAREAREAQEGVRAREAALEAANKAAADRKRAADEEAEALARERVKRQRLEEDVKVVTGKMERLRRMGSEKAGASEAAEELQAMRMLLRCNVCHERTKDVIITKCWHIFCSHCIQRNLETRNRKCPGCGVPFGQQDVKPFYFT